MIILTSPSSLPQSTICAFSFWIPEPMQGWLRGSN